MITVSGTQIEVICGDITDQPLDAVVNAANNHFWMGAGVAGAIKKRGGQEIEDAAIQLGPIEVGKAVITTAGALRAAHVIHAAGMGQDLKTSAPIVSAATTSSLEVADANELKSVAFPAIGTGVGGLGVEACAAAMLRATITYLSAGSELQLVRFVLFDQSGEGAFATELRRQFSKQGGAH